MLPDFVLLPPEVNSARIYAGPRSGSMWAAAAAWDGLAAALGSAASSFQSTVSGLTGGTWQGPTSMSMEVAATPYVEWLSATSAQAELAANQARLSAGAFEAAFIATVPPVAVAANRALLMTLIATNILGQNTAAIAATEAEYSEMWAQDVTAMTGYDVSTSAAEAGWTPFGKPPTRLAGPASQVSPVASTGSDLFSSLRQTLSTSMSRLQMLSTPAQFAMEPMNMVMGQLMSGNSMMGAADGSVPTMGPALMSEVGPGIGGVSTAQLSAGVVSASAGQASSIGALSAPASWAGAVPAATPASALAGMPSASVSPVSASLPNTPHLPKIGMPGRSAAAAHSAIGTPREAVAPRLVPG
jgi:PPE-repeat protein